MTNGKAGPEGDRSVETHPLPAGKRDLFREEALRHHLSRGEQGDLLEMTPGWVRWGFWVLLAVAGGAGALAFAAWRGGWMGR
jgi:hypothetical protein